MAEERANNPTPPSPGNTAGPDRPVPLASPPGLVSIVIPCCGMLEYTKLCVPSVLKHSRPPFELLFLDVGSLDGTAEYLAGVAAAAAVRVEVLRTPTDLGIGEACKEVVRKCWGEYLVLLNNDTVVSDGWLNQLVGLASLSPAVGLVGPMSNYAAPPQRVEVVPYRISPRQRPAGMHLLRETLVDVSAVAAFAREFREQHRGKWMEVQRLGGFCLLLKRQVLERIGLNTLDLWTDLSLFDTDVLSRKAREAGFTLACCRDLFVHHFGTRTFAHGAPEVEAAADGQR